MSEPEVFILADRTLDNVIQQIGDDQWQMKLPDWFQRGRSKADITLREIVNYHAYDDAWVPDMLAGTTMDEAGKDKFDGDLLGDKPKDNFAAIVETAVAAAKAVTDLQKTVHCSFGDFTIQAYFWQINLFRGMRARDIAKLIGADDRLPTDLVQGIWDEVAPHAEEWRKIGVFGPKIDVPSDASLQDKLLGLTGRQP
ncbi:MAG TPA: hypothetical protein VHC21_03315 [Candidatus Saccharimonadales bacterium]|nr:hypothetical protein [Candidatus Saccharimonadales bacterium]